MRLATQPQPRTRNGLLPEAKHVVLPKGIVASGFPSVRETCRHIGIEFDSWQKDLNRCILAKRSDGLYAADTVAMSIPRQVGKTFDVGAVVFALCIAIPGLTVVWTAHRFKVARETFNTLRALAKSPKLTPHLDYEAITTAAGNECIPFRNGSRIVFAARERGAIRGFTKVAVLILDEAQILTEAALADLAPTMNQATNPLIMLMGTPPKPTDPSEVFSRLRDDALAGESDDVLYVEFSAAPDADHGDKTAWAQANPSYPVRTPARAIQRMRRLLSDDDFAREGLGIWDSDSMKSLFPAGTWLLCAEKATPKGVSLGRPVLAASMSPDHLSVSLAGASKRSDGKIQVEIIEQGSPGKWFTDRVIEVAKRQTAPVVFSPLHAVGSLKQTFEDAKLKTREMNGSEYAQACGALFEAVKESQVRYVAPQPELDAAIGRASKKPSGDHWKWDGDGITALVAATQAVFAAANVEQRTFWGAYA